MSYLDTEEDIKKRRQLFARLTQKRAANQAMRQKVSLDNVKRTINEEQICEGTKSYSGSWFGASSLADEKPDRFDYTVPYRAQYEVKEQDENREPYELETEAIEGLCLTGDDDASSTTATTIPNIPKCQLSAAQTRSRILSKIAPSAASASVMNFEMVSTVQAPTELDTDEFTSTVSCEELRKEFFSNYRTNTSLPIYSHRGYVLNSINTYNVIIIEGNTGCGKTTQVPVYILEDAILDKCHSRSPVIYVTQPRRIAAKSIASRVCSEHHWTVGSIVGYQVGLEKCVSPQSVLIYCTAGVLLQKLIQEKSLKSYTHIIIDEAHERDSDTDLLLMMIRTLMRKEMSFFRLIVMSATMDIEKLKSYYTFKTDFGHRAITSPSVCRIGKGADNFNVQCVFFDRLRSTFNVKSPVPILDRDEPEVHEDCLKGAVEIVMEVIPHLDTFSEATKSTLVFLPGLSDIIKFHSMLAQDPKNHCLDIIPLHSCISSGDQFKVFEKSPIGRRKVILATNIAESSITVPDVGFIVDFCLTKVLRKDPVSKFPVLTLEWSSRDKCIQRAGRTGRCGKGKVFRMVPYALFHQFRDYAEPELIVAPLELSVLRVKNFDMGEIKALLAVVLDPPAIDDIRAAVLELKQIGALSSTYEGKLNDMDGDLTELGRIISTLPIDVRLSKLIVLANVLDVLEDSIIVAASLSTNHSMVKSLYGDPLRSYESNIELADGSFSDLFVSLAVYKKYMFYKEEQQKEPSWLDKYCSNNMLDVRKLNETAALAQEITTRLEEVNILVLPQPNRQPKPQEDELMLKVAICAAFYPHYFVNERLDSDDIDRSFSGLDPSRTVICDGFPPQSSTLYRTQLLRQLAAMKVADDADVVVDNSRLLLTFTDSSMLEQTKTPQIVGLDDVIQVSHGVSRSVLRALKLAEVPRLFIREIKSDAADERMRFYKNQISTLRNLSQENGTQRLLPSRTKLIVGREPDNSILFEVNSEDYHVEVANRDYIEVEFNESQDFDDLNKLYDLENEEDKLRLETRKKAGDLEQIDHPVFVNGYKLIGGPYSPIRMKFRSVLERSKSYNVEIDRNSVNSLLLDPEYKTNRHQLMVACTVQHNKRGKILIKDTTLMPSIAGLATVMSLLFAQYYRLVYNNSLRCISGAIFGIGWYENDEPIDKSYEVELAFDVHITNNDIKLINRAREYVSSLIRTVDVHNPGAPRNEMQRQLRDIILTLMKTQRFDLEEISFVDIDWSENKFRKDAHNVPKEQLNKLDQGRHRPFLPILETTIPLREWDFYLAVRNNLNLLESIKSYQSKIPLDGIRCHLCGNGQSNLYLIQSKIVNHLNSPEHNDRLQRFEEFETRARLNRDLDT